MRSLVLIVVVVAATGCNNLDRYLSGLTAYNKEMRDATLEIKTAVQQQDQRLERLEGAVGEMQGAVVTREYLREELRGLARPPAVDPAVSSGGTPADIPVGTARSSVSAVTQTIRDTNAAIEDGITLIENLQRAMALIDPSRDQERYEALEKEKEQLREQVEGLREEVDELKKRGARGSTLKRGKVLRGPKLELTPDHTSSAHHRYYSTPGYCVERGYIRRPQYDSRYRRVSTSATGTYGADLYSAPITPCRSCSPPL